MEGKKISKEVETKRYGENGYVKFASGRFLKRQIDIREYDHKVEDKSSACAPVHLVVLLLLLEVLTHWCLRTLGH